MKKEETTTLARWGLSCSENISPAAYLKTLGEVVDKPLSQRYLKKLYYEGSDPDLNYVDNFFRVWKNTHTYLEINDTQRDRTFFVRAVKRGDENYCKKIKTKVQNFLSALPDFSDFPMRVRERGRSLSSSMIFVVLTSDVNRCSALRAWAEIGHDVNRFISRLKKRYKQAVVVCRTFEAHKNKYPHVNLLVDLRERVGIFGHKKTYRIARARRDEIARMWHSFVDVQSSQNVENIVNYSAKYITKNITEETSALAMQWLTGKRSFAINEKWAGRAHDLIRTMSNSNLTQTQMTLVNTVHEVFTTEKRYFLVNIHHIKPVC